LIWYVFEMWYISSNSMSVVSRTVILELFFYNHSIRFWSLLKACYFIFVVLQFWVKDKLIERVNCTRNDHV
jgi:Gpi18-like mannosyltransferase